jgi:hypothetical protein
VAWSGGRRPYDLIRELIISGCIVAVLVVLLTVLFASSDPSPVTMKEWATQSPKDFLATTLQEVAETSLSATYGPPYQTTAQSGSTQGYGPLSPEEWFGQEIPGQDVHRLRRKAALDGPRKSGRHGACGMEIGIDTAA